MNNTADILSVEALFDMKEEFIIPSYQRGYRWTKNEIDALMSDINNSNDKYCLQPIVLQRVGKNKINIVDGQQRITTIAILQKILEVDFDKPLCKALIKSERKESDMFFLKEAERIIANNIKGKQSTERSILWERCQKCFFIVYWLEDAEKAEKVFQRLNIGKIPLSSAELFKAYYLTENKKESQMIHFLERWKYIETYLQDDSFYFFFSHDKGKCERYYSSRMDFLIELSYAIKNKKKEKDLKAEYAKNPIFIFAEFMNENGKECTVDSFMENIEKQFKFMLDIYSNDRKYAFLGFLLCCENSESNFDRLISAIEKENNLAENVAKILGESTQVNKNYYSILNKLEYGKDNVIIKNILLFYNVAKLLIYNARFDFNSYWTQNWDLEHIHARAEIKEKKELLEFCKQIKKEIENDNFVSDFEKFCSGYDSNDTKRLQNLEIWESLIWCIEQGGRIISKDNANNDIPWEISVSVVEPNNWRMISIKNLALLPSSVNRRIGNRSFGIKCNLIRNDSLNGYFIPPCTRDVFIDNKYSTDSTCWTESMGEAYLRDMCNVILKVLSKGGENG